MKTSEKQQQLLKSFKSKNTIVIAHGAYRSGKSMFLGYSFALFMHGNLLKGSNDSYSNRYFIGGYSFNNIINNVFTYISEMFKSLKYKEIRTLTDIRFVSENGEIKISIFNGSNRSSFQSIQSAGTFRGGFIDEAALLDEEFISVAVSRCLTFSDSKIFMTTNPEGSTVHYFYKKYVKNPKNLVYHLKITDNPLISDKKVDELKSMMSLQMIKQKIEGLWVGASGSVYPKLPKKITKEESPKVFDYLSFGIDYGEVDATAVVLKGFVGLEEYRLAEYYSKNGEEFNKTIIDYLEDIFVFINSESKKWKQRQGIDIYCEYSPSSLFNLLESNYKKFEVPVNLFKVSKRKKQTGVAVVKTRIDTTNILINSGKSFIVGELPFLEEAMATAVFDKQGVRLDDGSTNIDSLDADEYSSEHRIDDVLDLIGVV